MPQTPRSYLNNIVDQYYSQSDWSDYEELMKALERGDEHKVVDLLGKGCRCVRPGTLNTPLHLAVERVGWAFIVKRLLDGGAQVGFVNANNDTALHHAFFYQASDISINSMLTSYLKQSSVNLINPDGFSYLHIVCARSNLSFVKQFLYKMDVDVNSQVSKNSSKTAFAGYTALHFAVEYGKHDIAAYLLENGASVYVQDAAGSTPLHLACYRRNVDMIDLLLANDRAYINVIDSLGTSHFMAACMGSNASFVKQYLIVAYRRYNIAPITIVSAKMCDSLQFPYPGYRPLHLAAEFGRLDTVRTLLVHGAFCCAVTSLGDTPFTLATKGSSFEVCKLLKQYCEEFQAQIAKQALLAVQDESIVGSAMSSAPTTSPVDSYSYQNYSSPDTAYSSAPLSCEKSVTSVDLSNSDGWCE